jgi:15-cis-phytoene synthase
MTAVRPSPGGSAVEQAYHRCEEITRREAKNFAYGIRLLAPPKRQALSAVYALARRIDDIGDGAGEPGAKLTALAGVRTSLVGIRTGTPPPEEDPVLVGLADAARRYPIPLEAFDELIEGCEMDASGTTYGTYEELRGYCRRVAGSIGRLSLGVFGTPDRTVTDPMADSLGTALQITNILRDIVEDRDQLGRIYLPTEDISRFGCHPDLSGPVDAVSALVVFEAHRAEELFAHGYQLLPLLERRSRACVGTMAGIYRRLLRRIVDDPAAVLGGRVSVPTGQKLLVAARCLMGRAA